MLEGQASLNEQNKREGAVAILGGSFDPVHKGHIALARTAVSQLDVPELRLMPAKVPAHKSGFVTSEQDRVRMLRDIVEQNARLRLDTRELAIDRVSYSYLSMRALREELGDKRPIHFLMGWDSLCSLDKWYEWRSFVDLVNVVVVSRPPREALPSGSVARMFKQRLVPIEQVKTEICGKVAELAFDDVDISSTQVRTFLRDAACLPCDEVKSRLGQWLEPVTANYVVERQLYRASP